jgi:hypothetical protein
MPNRPSVPATQVIFPKLTNELCASLLAWIEARLRSWSEVWADLERPEVLALLESIGVPPLDPGIKTLAEASVLCVGGGNGNVSWKETPSCIDVDVFFMPPVEGLRALSEAQIGQLRTVFNRRVTPEILDQRECCAIEGVAYAASGKVRMLDFPKIGILHNGVIWSAPSLCRHCSQLFFDGRFCVHAGVITHESCLGA